MLIGVGIAYEIGWMMGIGIALAVIAMAGFFYFYIRLEQDEIGVLEDAVPGALFLFAVGIILIIFGIYKSWDLMTGIGIPLAVIALVGFIYLSLTRLHTYK